MIALAVALFTVAGFLIYRVTQQSGQTAESTNSLDDLISSIDDGMGSVAGMAYTTKQEIIDLVSSLATQLGVDPYLALAVAKQESNYNPAAQSSAGAIGVMQLMPATAAQLGIDPHDPVQNIQGGLRYLSMMLSRFVGDVTKALAAYNWGPGNVQIAIATYGGNWLQHAPAETQNYVANILNYSQELMS